MFASSLIILRAALKGKVALDIFKSDLVSLGMATDVVEALFNVYQRISRNWAAVEESSLQHTAIPSIVGPLDWRVDVVRYSTSFALFLTNRRSAQASFIVY